VLVAGQLVVLVEDGAFLGETDSVEAVAEGERFHEVIDGELVPNAMPSIRTTSRR
jgi:hypothetical protein